MKQELFFIHKGGDVSHAEIFDPLLKILLPAFVAGAEEIQIGRPGLPPKGVTGTYKKDGKSFPLNIAPDFQWADIFVRVKILACVSILPVEHQTGEIAVQFNGRSVPVSMETFEGNGETILRLKPASEPKSKDK